MAGVLISVGLNTKSDRLGGESVVSGTKKLVKWAVNMNDNLKSGNYKEFTKENVTVIKIEVNILVMNIKFESRISKCGT